MHLLVPDTRRTREALGLLVIAVLALALFAWLAASVLSSGSWAAHDPAVTAWAVSLRRDRVTQAARAITHLGGTIELAVLTVGTAGALLPWRRRYAGVLVVAMAGASAWTAGLKQAFGRARPGAELLLGRPAHSCSFPSGHSFNIIVFTGTLACFVLFSRARPGGKVLAVGTAALLTGAVGASRVYLGYHWMTDVLAGWSIGLAWLAVIGLAALTVREREAAPRRPASAPPLLSRRPRRATSAPRARAAVAGRGPRPPGDRLCATPPRDATSPRPPARGRPRT